MCNVQCLWNCFNLVDTCNIALILFLKCNVTKFRIPSTPLLVTVSQFVDPLPPLNVWRNLWMAPKLTNSMTCGNWSSMPHLQGLSNNSYPESNESNFTISLICVIILSPDIRVNLPRSLYAINFLKALLPSSILIETVAILIFWILSPSLC